MDVSGAAQTMASQASQSPAAGAAGNGTIGKDGFLQLLIAQMQNQDPMNPMEGQEMASQLAQFNSVEQLINVNQGLESLQYSQELMRMEMTNSMASSLAGKKVRALGNQVHLEAGGSANISYELNNAAENVTIKVKNASGTVVREETLTGVGAGEHSWEWDGYNNSGSVMPEGRYTVEVNATNGSSDVQALMFISGEVQKVSFTKDGVMLSIGNVDIPIGNVESVQAGTSSESK